VDPGDALLHLFGVVSRWNFRLRGFGFLLFLPILVVGLTDWRVRRKR
jgi:hypothetical protein